jgi:RecA-family ATPase
LQLSVATVLGRDWLGSMPEQGPVIFVSAEDDAEELHRRLSPIIAHYGARFADLEKDFHALPLVGEDALLAAPDRSGLLKPTELYARLKEAARDKRPKLIVIDTSADVFGGNENDRGQVRQFVTGLLRPLALAGDGGVLLTSHPSLQGINTGTGLSGSTGWHNSVRARAFMRKAVTDGKEPDPDLRVLEFMKNNYGRHAETITLRWKNGLFVPEAAPSHIERAAAEAPINDTFLRCLDAKTAQGIIVVAAPGRGYAPSVFEDMPEAGGLKSRALAPAMERLLSSGRIKVETFGPPSKQRTRLVRVTASRDE